MKHNKTKQDIIRELLNDKLNKCSVIGGRAGLLISILILYDMWGFDKDDIHEFLKQYEQLFNSYADGKEDVNAWIQGVKDELDIDITEQFRRMV